MKPIFFKKIVSNSPEVFTDKTINFGECTKIILEPLSMSVADIVLIFDKHNVKDTTLTSAYSVSVRLCWEDSFCEIKRADNIESLERVIETRDYFLRQLEEHINIISLENKTFAGNMKIQDGCKLL